jgi:hypothetical protein
LKTQQACTNTWIFDEFQACDAGPDHSASWTAAVGSDELVMCSGNKFLVADPVFTDGHGLGQHVQFASALQFANVRMKLGKCESTPVIFVQATSRIMAWEELLLKGPDCRLPAPRYA